MRERVEAVLRALPVTGSGQPQVLCVDGPSGSGKSTLARALVDALPGAVLVNTDHLLDGWEGLPTLAAVLLSQVVEPHLSGRAVQHRCYDWHAGHFTTPLRHPRAHLLVLEGVGAGAVPVRAHADLVVWVDAPLEVRRRRAEQRDPTTSRWWDAWRRSEAAHHAEHATRENADLVVED